MLYDRNTFIVKATDTSLMTQKSWLPASFIGSFIHWLIHSMKAIDFIANVFENTQVLAHKLQTTFLPLSSSPLVS